MGRDYAGQRGGAVGAVARPLTAEQHRRELGPAGEALGVAFAVVFLDQAGELVSGDLLEKLTEKAGRLYHECALRGLVVGGEEDCWSNQILP